MAYLVKGILKYEDGKLKQTENVSAHGISFLIDKSSQYNLHNIGIFPGFADVHVHLREPGFSYKETVKTGTLAAAHGGYTCVLSMPNLKPVPDNETHLAEQLRIIRDNAVIAVYPYASISVNEDGKELSDMNSMMEAIAFSDDGRGVADEAIMERAMLKARKLDKIIAAHCEDICLVNGGYINQGKYSAEHGHKGICNESEWGPIKRDIELMRRTGCKYHVCHVSTKESVELIRKAKSEGLDITCETAPHYLVLNDSCLEEDGRFKMNPPIRSERDRQALLEGICDGTIDMIATDHAPHSAEEKSKGLAGSLMGVVGLETAFPVLYTELVKKNVIPLKLLLKLMSDNPRNRFGIPPDDSICIWDLDENYEIDPEQFCSKGRSTPFAGMKVYGKCLLTIYGGNAVWKDTQINLIKK